MWSLINLIRSQRRQFSRHSCTFFISFKCFHLLLIRLFSYVTLHFGRLFKVPFLFFFCLFSPAVYLTVWIQREWLTLPSSEFCHWRRGENKFLNYAINIIVKDVSLSKKRHINNYYLIRLYYLTVTLKPSKSTIIRKVTPARKFLEFQDEIFSKKLKLLEGWDFECLYKHHNLINRNYFIGLILNHSLWYIYIMQTQK